MAEKSFFRSPDIPPQVLAYREEIDPVQMLSEVTLQRISEVFQFVMRKRQDKLDPDPKRIWGDQAGRD